MRPRLIAAIALIAIAPALAACGSTSTPAADPIATAPYEPPVISSKWTSENLSQSVFDEYSKDATAEIALKNVLCIHVSGPTWECLLQSDPDEYSVNINVTADDETMTWVSRPLN